MDEVEREDRTIKCRDCGNPFVFSAGEQAFFEQKQLHDPVRCKGCRELKKQEKLLQGN